MYYAQDPFSASRRVAPQWVWVLIVVLIGLNLRPFLTAIGPMTAAIRAGADLDYRGIAWLTLLPLLLMGLGAIFEPVLRWACSARFAMLAGLFILGVGIALRFIDYDGVALIATAILCGLGVSIIQSIFPGVIKQLFAERLPVIMGVYSASLMAGGALGAQVTPLVEIWFGSWRAALSFWALPAISTLLLAWHVLPRGKTIRRRGRERPAGLWWIRRTWLLVACFGLINTGYAALVAWLPSFYGERGWNNADAGGTDRADVDFPGLLGPDPAGDGGAPPRPPALASGGSGFPGRRVCRLRFFSWRGAVHLGRHYGRWSRRQFRIDACHRPRPFSGRRTGGRAGCLHARRGLRNRSHGPLGDRRSA